MTHTVAEMEVSPTIYDKIYAQLAKAGWDVSDKAGIDMTGIRLVRASEPKFTSQSVRAGKSFQVKYPVKVGVLDPTDIRVCLVKMLIPPAGDREHVSVHCFIEGDAYSRMMSMERFLDMVNA